MHLVCCVILVRWLWSLSITFLPSSCVTWLLRAGERVFNSALVHSQQLPLVPQLNDIKNNSLTAKRAATDSLAIVAAPVREISLAMSKLFLRVTFSGQASLDLSLQLNFTPYSFDKLRVRPAPRINQLKDVFNSLLRCCSNSSNRWRINELNSLTREQSAGLHVYRCVVIDQSISSIPRLKVHEAEVRALNIVLTIIFTHYLSSFVRDYSLDGTTFLEKGRLLIQSKITAAMAETILKA